MKTFSLASAFAVAGLCAVLPACSSDMDAKAKAALEAAKPGLVAAAQDYAKGDKDGATEDAKAAGKAALSALAAPDSASSN